MKTLDVEIAVMEYLDVRRNIVVPNVFWGMPGLSYEADVISLTPSGYATEIEIKVSKSDLLRDKRKRHNHKSKLFKYLYFAVPEKLQNTALEVIPERAGLLVVVENNYGTYSVRNIKKVREAECNKMVQCWDYPRRFKLAKLGAMRILSLKMALKNREKGKENDCEM